MTGNLFGTTGVRKVYGSEFSPNMALKLGKALGTYLGQGRILLARDARTTGKMIADAFASGVMSTGIDVVRAGMIPTPTLAYNTKARGFETGVMITASHNPPEYTGIKFWRADSMGYTSGEERKLEAIYESGEFQVAAWDDLGTESVSDDDVKKHIEAISERLNTKAIAEQSFKVAIDPGNGAACVMTSYLLRKLGCKVITINAQLDGYFPGRPSEPEEENLSDLMALTKDAKADIGIAHDGDADRVTFVTEKGEFIRGDRVIALLAREAIKQSDNRTVVTTVDSSLVLDETVEKAGGNTVRTPVGDIEVAMKIKELGAAIGGEACGVYILPEFHLAPEPFLAVCMILELIAEQNQSFGELISKIPAYPLTKGKVRCENSMKPKVMQQLQSLLPNKLGKPREIVTVDGIGLFLDDSWILVRPSGTEPVIRVTCEASSEKQANSLLAKAKDIVSQTVDDA
ncbi:MAG: phosphoglucosamine mutase [Candidatus Thorarchaeota archaeon]|nr:phosphoglucosamine mutase [Candidatus Thorarchaeota archaeon]